MSLSSEINGYTLVLVFGSKTLTNGIYQAFIETIKNQQGVSSFWNISNISIHNGHLYNNTYLLNWTIAHNRNLYAVAYWYFVYPYNQPPLQMSGILWYWPSDSSKYPDIYLFPRQVLIHM
jgi:hypothetical protein